MWHDVLSVAPRPLILACLLYAAASWLITGPLVGQRVADIHHYPRCVAGIKAAPLPKDPTAQLLDELRNSPWVNDPVSQIFGLDRYVDILRQSRQNAGEKPSVDAEGKCRCLIERAIAGTRTAWALYAGSMRLIAWPEVTQFAGVMAREAEAGACHG